MSTHSFLVLLIALNKHIHPQHPFVTAKLGPFPTLTAAGEAGEAFVTYRSRLVESVAVIAQHCTDDCIIFEDYRPIPNWSDRLEMGPDAVITAALRQAALLPD